LACDVAAVPVTAQADARVEIAAIDNITAVYLLILFLTYRLSPFDTAAPDTPAAPLADCNRESTIASE